MKRESLTIRNTRLVKNSHFLCNTKFIQEFSKWVIKNASVLDLAEQQGNASISGFFEVSSDAELGSWWCISNKIWRKAKCWVKRLTLLAYKSLKMCGSILYCQLYPEWFLVQSLSLYCVECVITHIQGNIAITVYWNVSENSGFHSKDHYVWC